MQLQKWHSCIAYNYQKVSTLHSVALAWSADNAPNQLLGMRRYEKTAFQQEVQRGFDALQDSSWVVLDASKSIEALQTEVCHLYKSDAVYIPPGLFLMLYCECVYPSHRSMTSFMLLILSF